MTKYLYPRLAVNSIKKNKRLYLPYILTSAGMVMMFYIISFLANGNALDNVTGGNIMQQTLTFGYIVIAVFSLIFLFYTNSFLIRRRKKEFGLYNILGMGKWNLGRVLVWESIVVSLISIISGLFCGILFSKLAELAMIKVLHAENNFTLNIEWKSVEYTVIVFAAIFLFLLINTLRQIKSSEPIELLKSESAGEKAPKANWIFALAGFVILVGAYMIAVMVQSPLESLLWFFVAVVMVIVATFLLFVSGSVAFCKMLQKNKKYYYKTNHFVSVSSMTFRMKRNGAGLASICILCTMVLVMITSTTCLYTGSEDVLNNRFPRDVVVETVVDDLSQFDSEALIKAQDSAYNAVQKQGVTPQNLFTYKYAQFTSYFDGDELKTSDIRNYDELSCNQIYAIPLSDYNRLMNKNEHLADDECFVYTSKAKKFRHDKISIENSGEYKVKAVLDDFVRSADNASEMTILPTVFIIVNDIDALAEPLMGLADFYGGKFVKTAQLFAFNLDCDDEREIEIYNAVNEELKPLSEQFRIDMSSKASERESFYGLYGSLFFLGILLGIVFIFATVLIIYYKQISEGYEDQSRFEIMQKVGMTEKEIRQSINSQVLTVFFIPLLMSAVHLGFAFPMIYKMLIMFGITDIMFLVFVNLACFAVFTLFYIVVYKITSRAYYSIVSGVRD